MCQLSIVGPSTPVHLHLRGREVPCKAIIFDKDGTLVDPTGMQSHLTRLAALRAVARASQGRLAGAAPGFAPMVGPERATAFPASDPSAAEPEAAVSPASADAEANEDGECDVPNTPRLMPGVKPMLATFRQMGLGMAVATGDRRQRAEASLNALGVDEQFAVIISIDDVAHGKPSPDMVYACCARLGCTPDEVIVVGDSPADLQMGRAAGVAACIGVAPGYVSARLEDLADIVLPTVAELSDLLATE